MRPGLQEWIHKFEEGTGVRYIKLALLWIVLAGFTTLYDLREMRNFSAPEAMDMSQLARNISEGRGFTTRMIRPLSLAMLQHHQGRDGASLLRADHPDISNAPAYPVILAALMKVLPFRFEMGDQNQFTRYQPEVLIAVFNQLLFFVVLSLVLSIGQRLFDAPVAWMAVLLLVGGNLIWRYATSGLPTMLLMVVFLGLIQTLIRLEEAGREELPDTRRILRFAACLGLLLGLGTLTRYSFGWLAVPVLGYAAWIAGPKRAKALMMAGALMLLVVSPWLVRNYRLSGALFGTAGYALQEGTVVFPGTRLPRSMPQDFGSFLKPMASANYTQKLRAEGASIIGTELPSLGGSLAMLLFVPAMMISFKNAALRRMRWFLVGTLLTLIVVQALSRTSLAALSPLVSPENMVILIAPLVFLFASATFFLLLDQVGFTFPQLRGAAVVVFWAFCSLPLIIDLLPPKKSPFVYPPYFPPIIQECSQWMAEKELIMTDMPWATAWYGNRPSLWLTLDAGAERSGDFFRVNDFMKAVNALYLSPVSTDVRFLTEILKSQDHAWSRFAADALRGNLPSGFPLKNSSRVFFPDQIFLSDRVRWKPEGR